MSKARKTFRFRGRRLHASWFGAVAIVLEFVALHPSAIAEPQLSRGPIGVGSCDAGPADAAQRNRQGLTQLTFATFRRPETGWAVYEPLIAHEIGTRCDAATPAFAGSLAAWQSTRGLPRTGVMDEATLAAMTTAWQQRRTFVAANVHGCPAPPSEASLGVVPANESYGAKIMLLRPGALAAYRSMIRGQ